MIKPCCFSCANSLSLSDELPASESMVCCLGFFCGFSGLSGFLSPANKTQRGGKDHRPKGGKEHLAPFSRKVHAASACLGHNKRRGHLRPLSTYLEQIRAVYGGHRPEKCQQGETIQMRAPSKRQWPYSFPGSESDPHSAIRSCSVFIANNLALLE